MKQNNSCNNALIKCPHCGKIFKCLNQEVPLYEDNSFSILTDMGGEFIIDKDFNTTCLNCEKDFELNNTNFMLCEDWISNMIFKIGK